MVGKDFPGGRTSVPKNKSMGVFQGFISNPGWLELRDFEGSSSRR